MTFAPYADLAQPFRVGLAPLDPADMLVRDGDAARYLAEKRRLLDAAPDEVFAAKPETQDAQEAVARLLAANLREHHGVEAVLDREMAPLAAVSLHVQEDLLVMRRDAGGWRLVAGSLSFPSSWSLREKFGRPLEAIHAPVPGVNARMGARLARIFDMLRVPVWRQNWSLQGDDRLGVPRREGERGGHDSVEGPLRLRLEYQTLTRLETGPGPGDLLFTVRIFLAPFATLERRRALAGKLLAQLEAMDAAELSYKGLAPRLDEIRARLDEIREAA